MKLGHPFLQGEINSEKAKERFREHRDDVLNALPMLDPERRSKVLGRLAELAERLTLTGKRSKKKRSPRSRERDYIRDLRGRARSLFLKLEHADPAIKERIYRSLAKLDNKTLDDAEMLATGRKQYLLAIHLINALRSYAPKPKEASGPKPSPLPEVVNVLARIWKKETGQSISNTTKTPNDGFPMFVTAFMKAVNNIAASEGRTVWQPTRRVAKDSNDLRRYDEATAIRNAIEALRADGA